jgi:hypothetical protein
VLSYTDLVVHPDGTIFTFLGTHDGDGNAFSWVVGIDSATGAQKFTVPMPAAENSYGIMIAGDGYAYAPYASREFPQYGEGVCSQLNHFRLLRIDTSGSYDDIDVMDFPSGCTGDLPPPYEGIGMITNADQGVLLTWDTWADYSDPGAKYMATVTGGGVSVTEQPVGNIDPVLQAQDGSYIGMVYTGPNALNMIAFDASGGVRWMVPGNYQPQIATADGGLIATDQDTGAAITFDQDGNATGQVSLPTYSWKGAYQTGSIHSIIPVLDLARIISTASFAAVAGGNLTGNGFYLANHTFGLVFCGPDPGDGHCDITPDVKFSYLPVSGLTDQTYANAIDFSRDYRTWVDTVKHQAYNQYKAAFDHLPAIVAAEKTTSPLYGGPSTATSFEHTNYISGYWMPAGEFPRLNDPYPPNGYTVANRTSWSWVYYLPIMGSAQKALGTWDQGDHGNLTPLSPTYKAPPMDPATGAQFNQVMSAIGRAIGFVAAHETGHQLRLLTIDCDTPYMTQCDSPGAYENYSTGFNHEWVYKIVAGVRLHWTHDGTCAIEKYLLGSAKYDTTCPQ